MNRLNIALTRRGLLAAGAAGTAAAAGITTRHVCGVVCSWVGTSHDQN